MDILITLSLVFMVWMCIDCMQRKEHFIWIIIMVVLFPVGAVAYYFTVKSKTGGVPTSSILTAMQSKNKIREVETEETLQLKDMISKFHKAYHYEKLGHAYLEQKQFELAAPQFRAAIERDAFVGRSLGFSPRSYEGQQPTSINASFGSSLGGTGLGGGGGLAMGTGYPNGTPQ